MKANGEMTPAGMHQQTSFDSGRLSHAYIAPGSLADSLAMSAVCSGAGKRPCMNCAHCDKSSRGIHPDITVISKPESKREILVAQIRELNKDAIIVPNEADKKVYIVNDADLMNNEAQNAFLRLLEEPPLHAVFILRTYAPAALLETVRSRCVDIRAGTPEELPDADATDAANDFFSALRDGNSSIIKLMFRLEKLDKEQFARFLTAARMQAAAELRAASQDRGDETRVTLSLAEHALCKACEFLDLNVGTGHISGMICAAIMK